MVLWVILKSCKLGEFGEKARILTQQQFERIDQRREDRANWADRANWSYTRVSAILEYVKNGVF